MLSLWLGENTTYGKTEVLIAGLRTREGTGAVEEEPASEGGRVHRRAPIVASATLIAEAIVVVAGVHCKPPVT